MALLGLGKKGAEKKAKTCACKGNLSDEEAKQTANDCCPEGNDCCPKAKDCCPEAKDGICCVKVLGAGCKSCHAMYENTKVAIKNMGLLLEVAYITNPEEFMVYGVMRMPALVINEKLVSTGKVLKAKDVEELLRNAAAQ